MGRLNSVEKTIEEMESLANSNYSKASYAPPVSFSPLSRERSRKRVKDTSSDTASPHTALVRPIAKSSKKELMRSRTNPHPSPGRTLKHRGPWTVIQNSITIS